MKKSIRFLLILSILLLCLTAGNTAMLMHMKAVLQMNLTIGDWKSYMVAAFIIMMAFIHLVSVIVIGSHLRKDSQENILRSASIVFCVFSFFLLLVDVVMLQEIGKEALIVGDTMGEWNIVFFNHAVHILFSLILLIYCLTVKKSLLESETSQHALKDEAVFLTVNQVGVITAVVGLGFIFFLLSFQIPDGYAVGLRFLAALILLLPYFLAVLYWICTKQKEKPVEWYDEKQFQDISHAALMILLVSVVGMGILYGCYSKGLITLDLSLFFPVYLFLVLLSFSGTTLYLNKKA
ncbi:MAG: hypothetical protein GYA18_11115 [Chloroflexi bacterium]|nr:hypothetical protein [Chloroflexota bacterium]